MMAHYVLFMKQFLAQKKCRPCFKDGIFV